MRRKGHLYHLIPTPENLRLAFWKAAKGKHHRDEVVKYRANLDHNLGELQRQVIENDLDIGHYRFFQVRDPKPRRICAASFPERVLHHAIMNICEPVLDSYEIHDSYACRKGRGTHRALARAQAFARRFPWYLKLDVRKYFDSVDHGIMIRLLARRIKDQQVLGLFKILLDSYHTHHGKGLPIGNLISQHLANFYLACLDHWIKEDRHIRGYLRYMDDFILFSRDKASLKAELLHVEDFLADKLKLELKQNVQLNRCHRGIPFLGFRVFPQKILLAARSRKRFVKKFIAYENKYLIDFWSERELAMHVSPLVEFTKAADTEGLRRGVIARFGVSP
jgi:RNA-directed DNA polymerase